MEDDSTPTDGVVVKNKLRRTRHHRQVNLFRPSWSAAIFRSASAASLSPVNLRSAPVEHVMGVREFLWWKYHFDPIKEDPLYQDYMAGMEQRRAALLEKIGPVFVPK